MAAFQTGEEQKKNVHIFQSIVIVVWKLFRLGKDISRASYIFVVDLRYRTDEEINRRWRSSRTIRGNQRLSVGDFSAGVKTRTARLKGTLFSILSSLLWHVDDAEREIFDIRENQG